MRRKRYVLSDDRRYAEARRVVQTRWSKNTPVADQQTDRWYGLFCFDNPNYPQVIMWSQDKTELRERARTEDRPLVILDVAYNPTKFTVVREFQPDAGAQIDALNAVAKGGQ